MRAVAGFISVLTALIGFVGTIAWNIRAYRQYGRDPEGRPIVKKEPVVQKAIRLTVSAALGLLFLLAIILIGVIMIRQTFEVT